jgi:hypothetical protein
MKSGRNILLLGIIPLLVGCVAESRKPPQQPERPAPVPPVRPRPSPPPAAPDWRDISLTPGAWSYRGEANGSQALFGTANGEASFILRCDRQRQQISAWREGISSGNAMTIRTSFGARNFTLSVQPGPTPYVYATAAARDSFLDSIAFSRGRLTVEVPGQPMLVIPAWPEPARVIEDCRG